MGYQQSLLKTLPLDDKTSMKDLTLKLTMLLALALASWASEICNLDVRFLSKSLSCYSFHFSTLSKKWNKGKPRPVLTFNILKEEPSLCVCNTIDLYLKRSEPWRISNQTSYFLVILNLTMQY